jgi:hypothetical protein
MLLQGTAINKLAPLKGRTALHLACLEGHDMVAQHLNEAGASVTAVDELEAPALGFEEGHIAGSYKHIIPTTIKDPTNTTPFSICRFPVLCVGLADAPELVVAGVPLCKVYTTIPLLLIGTAIRPLF